MNAPVSKKNNSGIAISIQKLPKRGPKTPWDLRGIPRLGPIQEAESLVNYKVFSENYVFRSPRGPPGSPRGPSGFVPFWGRIKNGFRSPPGPPPRPKKSSRRGSQERKNVVQEGFGSLSTDPKRAPRGPRRGPKLKMPKTLNLLTVQKMLLFVAAQRGPEWAPNRLCKKGRS